ncbi:protein kinase family protein [Actinoalloteichus hymeniacidonis]|uniref:Aminoglycoside phosphotransferase n=1 Tax=Actinoalloteichus hymeniacidonis TaxID=340345 RepID=A0AAC9MXA6_9PSEU|nr:hypothetical protein [Actinoalloteichus hymeniacidonis]AOS62084.1 aminoglycoside phosphotransferase [Actinoalloteichus hymeniacidonis]MBB5909894.1 aminoglycoside phosphotransferase [Actinoalloteichus hymeniacidonis]
MSESPLHRPTPTRIVELPTAEAVRLRCVRLLGPCEILGDRSMPHGEALVLELAARDGALWIAKTSRQAVHYEREKAALRDWAPTLGDRAPQLVHVDDEAQLLVMTRVPGASAPTEAGEQDPAIHRQAGELARGLHDCVPPYTDPAPSARLVAKLDRWIAIGVRAGLLSSAEIDFAVRRVGELVALGPAVTVASHLDFQPRNWLVDASGTLRLIDFGRAGRDRWLADTERMLPRYWRDRPELAAAFFTGYGRTPTDAELHAQRCQHAYGALSTIVWAHQHDDPGFLAEGRAQLAEQMAAAD